MGSDRKAPAPEPSAQAVAGWQMVPVKPTEDMLWRGHMKIDFDRSGQNTYELEHESQEGSTIRTDMLDAWAAMLASAPSTPPPAVVEAEALDEHVHAVVRSVQPYLDVRCKAWQDLTEQCRYWLKAERAHGIAPKAAQPNG